MKLFMTEAQIGQLLELAHDSARDHALFHVALSTGLRVSDLSTLLIEGVVDKAADLCIAPAVRVKMRKTKTYVERPLRQDCRLAIARYLIARGKAGDTNPYLFRPESHNGRLSMGPMNRSSIWRIYRRYLSQLFPAFQLRGNGCHVTRRSVAKLINLRTGRLEPAAAFLGHTKGNLASVAAYIDMDGWGQKADQAVEELTW